MLLQYVILIVYRSLFYANRVKKRRGIEGNCLKSTNKSFERIGPEPVNDDPVPESDPEFWSDDSDLSVDSEDESRRKPPDLVESVCAVMGQRSSILNRPDTKPKLSLTWVLRNHPRTQSGQQNQEPPIKFQYKARRRSVESAHRERASPSEQQLLNNGKLRPGCDPPTRTKSEPSLNTERIRDKHRHRKRSSRAVRQDKRFGYEIQDVDAFLAKASLEKPANIPVVLAFPSVLYQTRLGGYQEEISLPLGMVVNAVFKNQSWLYVQTPHAEEGYVNYSACLPLGILPPKDDKTSPCWEKSTDVFPKPCGNMTDTEKLSSRSECSASRCHSRRSRNGGGSSCGERSVDRLYLRAAACARNRGTRQTLLAIDSDYVSDGKNTLSVRKGDVVALIGANLNDWFWVRARDGSEGFIPAAVAGHGFL